MLIVDDLVKPIQDAICPLCMYIYDIDNLKKETEVLGTAIVKYRVENKIQLGIYIDTGDSSTNGVYVDYVRFCPMCGRKLNEVEDGKTKM